VLTPANSAYFTKIVEYEGGAQGIFGGIWSVFMSAGKSTGPIVAGYALNLLDGGTGNWIIFVLCVPVLAINVLCLPFIAGTMKKMDKVIKNLASENKLFEEEEEARRFSEQNSELNTSLLKDFSSDAPS
jgi:MFS family permease